MTVATMESTITDHEAAQIDRANATKATPVVFVHGLWLLPSSWERWVTLFEKAGYVGVTPGWPDDPYTVAEAREHPEVFAGKGITEIADYEEAIVRRLDRIGVRQDRQNARPHVVQTEVALAVEVENYRLVLKIRDQYALRHLDAIRKGNLHARNLKEKKIFSQGI